MSTYYIGNIPCDSNYLEHHGVLGMKWGKHLKSAVENMLGITAKRQLDAAKGGEALFRENYKQASQPVAQAQQAYKQALSSHQNVQSQYQMSNQNARGMMGDPSMMTTQRDVDNSARNLQKAKANADAAVGRQNSARKAMMTAKQDVKDKQAKYDKTIAGRVDKAVSKLKGAFTNTGKNIGGAVNKLTGATAKKEYEQAKKQQEAAGGSSAMNEYVDSKKKAYDKSIVGRVENAIAARTAASAKAKVEKKNAREQKDGTAAKREVERLEKLKRTVDTNNYSVKKQIAQNDLEASKKTKKIDEKIKQLDSMGGSAAASTARAQLLAEKASVEKERASKNQAAAGKSKFSDAYRDKVNSDLETAKNTYASSKLGKKEAREKKVANAIRKVDQTINAIGGKYDGTKVKSEAQQKADYENSLSGRINNAINKEKQEREQRVAERSAKKAEAARKKREWADSHPQNPYTKKRNPDTKSSTHQIFRNPTGMNVDRHGGSGGGFEISERGQMVMDHQSKIRAAQEAERREIEQAKKNKR